MYCSVEQVKKKDLDGLLDNLTDNEIKQYLEEATKVIEYYVGYSFEKTYEVYDSTEMNIYSNKIFFDKPIIEILEINDTGTVEPYYKKGSRKLKASIINGYSHKFSSNTIVKGYFGYESIPFDIQEACALTTIWIVEQKDSLDIGDRDMEIVDFVTVSYHNPKEGSSNQIVIPKRIKHILSKYRITRMALI
jgi:hypothetical protein